MNAPQTVEPWRDEVEEAARLLESGGVVAIPTDTLYGLAAWPFDRQAVERVFRIKGRARGMALPLLVAEVEEIYRYAAAVGPRARRLIASLLPGAVTVVLPKAAHVPEWITGGRDTVGLRVPDHPVPRALARRLGGPITGTSANLSGRPSLSRAEEVRRELGARVDLVLEDGGAPPRGKPSTVVDLTGPEPRVLREGALSARQVLEAWGL